ncbi:hypothetical protein HPB47_017268 [Ixodes persulcatus]|uniref:Uncharacterized protein n=1 Tax=Ixodes persulcatus TaxID=34615 RepID=A0AC60QQR3_IXOPE|nr:hypothetical protein HPB47_017268 [Ixodes persulcatus]
MDGNFEQAPEGFFESYVVLVPVGQCTVPVVYEYMTRKIQDSYKVFLAAVVSECGSPDLNPAAGEGDSFQAFVGMLDGLAYFPWKMVRTECASYEDSHHVKPANSWTTSTLPTFRQHGTSTDSIGVDVSEKNLRFLAADDASFFSHAATEMISV